MVLERCALSAAGPLGKNDGSLANPKVRIPLPLFLENDGRPLKLRSIGRSVSTNSQSR